MCFSAYNINGVWTLYIMPLSLPLDEPCHWLFFFGFFNVNYHDESSFYLNYLLMVRERVSNLKSLLRHWHSVNLVMNVTLFNKVIVSCQILTNLCPDSILPLSGNKIFDWNTNSPLWFEGIDQNFKISLVLLGLKEFLILRSFYCDTWRKRCFCHHYIHWMCYVCKSWRL